MKDLNCPRYWATFGDLGPAMGRANMPSPKEASDTVLRLMRERDDAIALAEEARKNASILLTQVDTFLLTMSNQAADLGYELRNTAKVSNTATGAKLRALRREAIDAGMELMSESEIVRHLEDWNG
jgi:hypothetical protein